MRSTTVRCRTNNTITILVQVDDNLVAHTNVRFTSRGEKRMYTYPALPAKRWWGEHIADVDPRDRDHLHQFIGLS